MGLNAHAIAAIRARLQNPRGQTEEGLLYSVLRMAASWRSTLIANSLISMHGPVIHSGPFQGMRYIAHAAEGALLPRLIGCYESELHPHIQALVSEGLDQIVDVGCAEGYYAVGLARLAPSVRVRAYDIDPAARTDCAALAALNGVTDRVVVGERFAGEDFAALEGSRTLVFMDIEGGEAELLDPLRYPALRTLKILVETHPGPTTLCEEIAGRFEASHDIVRIDQGPKLATLPAFVAAMPQLDQLIAVWEFRRWATPWLVMRPKSSSAWG